MKHFLNKTAAAIVSLLLVFQSLAIPFTVLAQEESSSPSPEPTATEQPSAGPLPTAAPSPTDDPTLAPLPSPSDDPAPTPDPTETPSATPAPTESPTSAPSADTSGPSDSPSPSETPAPSPENILPLLPQIQEHPPAPPKPDLVAVACNNASGLNNVCISLLGHTRVGHPFGWGVEITNQGDAPPFLAITNQY